MTTPLLYEDPTAAAFDALPTTTEHLLRTKEIPWDIYMTARLISDQDLQLLRRYDKRDAQQRAKLLAEGGSQYVAALLSVLRNVTKDETVQYVLALLDDMLKADPARAALFHDGPAAEADPYAVLLRLLPRNDWFTEEKSALILAAVLAARPGKGALARTMAEGGAHSDPVARTVASFLEWIVAQLRRAGHPTRGVPTAVHCLSVLLREGPVRPLFLRSGGAALLSPLIRVPPAGAQLNIQLLYESILCCWELSFYRPAAEALATDGVVGGLVDVLRLAQKEKLVRAALLALRNLMGQGAPRALEFAVVEKGLPKAVETRLAQNWDDDDVPALLEWMQGRLEEGVLSLTSLDRFKMELASGVLRWSPLHDSEAFWAENAERLVDSNCALLKQLLALLEASRDPTTLAVACKDLGQFAAFHAHGRGIVGQLRGKEVVMRLMAHPDTDVQREALVCVQRLLLARDKVDFMQAGVAS